jgi:lipopolysaccharide/colanic/teichoic acid biosynthesis glycosyltransferase
MSWWLILINAIVPLLLAEALDWFPWLAERVIGRAARMLPVEQRDRYEQEWLADMDTVPGRGFSKLLLAVKVLLAAPWTRAELLPHGPRLRHAMGKRMFDVVVSAVALVMISPLLVTIAVAIRLDSTGPALFWRRCFDLEGRRIYLLKFRTMTPGNAPDLPATPGVWAAYRTHDPRVTRVGRILRRMSLDELPQLLNVLRGDLSLVGLPPIPDGFRLPVPVVEGSRAGLVSSTPLTQGIEDVLRREALYVKSWSLRTDLAVLLRAVAEVLRRPV